MLFRGFDRSEETEGLHHGTVFMACRIVSGRGDGFLTEDKRFVFQGTDRSLDGDTSSKIFFPRARSASPKTRKTGGGGDDDVIAADQSAEMKHHGRKRRILYLGSEDVHTEESEGISVPDPLIIVAQGVIRAEVLAVLHNHRYLDNQP